MLVETLGGYRRGDRIRVVQPPPNTKLRRGQSGEIDLVVGPSATYPFYVRMDDGHPCWLTPDQIQHEPTGSPRLDPAKIYMMQTIAAGATPYLHDPRLNLSLNDLLKDGLIHQRAAKNSHRRIYELTTTGRVVLEPFAGTVPQT